MGEQALLNISASEAAIHPVLAWLLRKRTSARLAFILRSVSMVAGAGLSLIWARLLLDIMGKELNGLFLTFLAVVQLGGIGDLGISGAMGVKAMQHLSRGEDEACQRFLSNARGTLLVLALALALGFGILSPWLPELLHFIRLPGAGSLKLLFAAGGIGIALTIVNGYLQTLNYIHGNVVWPVLPGLLFVQLAFVGQLLLAAWHVPLWGQYTCHIVLSLVAAIAAWWMLRISHPWIGNLSPIRFNFREIRPLVAMSFWSYLGTLGNLLYVTTDRILINAGFGSELIPAYRSNYKLCELGTSFLAIATFVALPGIVYRILQADPDLRATAIAEVSRLQQLQTFAAAAAGFVFLAANDTFISLWLGAEFRVPLSWQIAFALTFVITIAGDVGIQLLGRLDHHAIRIAGLTIGGSGLLNLALSASAMHMGSILGISVATVIAQSVTSLVMSYHTSRLLQTPWRPWVLRGWAIPAAFMILASVVRAFLPPVNLAQSLLLGIIYSALLAGLALILGLRPEILVDEWRRMRRTFS